MAELVRRPYRFYGMDACMADLMRPGMYGAYHHITVPKYGEGDCVDTALANVVGTLCENNDWCDFRGSFCCVPISPARQIVHWSKVCHPVQVCEAAGAPEGCNRGGLVCHPLRWRTLSLHGLSGVFVCILCGTGYCCRRPRRSCLVWTLLQYNGKLRPPELLLRPDGTVTLM